ncbi:peptidase [Methanosarcinales archaeon]|nr:MAG: peptidase [Methanosarcinales archaeon]
MNVWWYVLAVFVSYWTIVKELSRRGVLERYGITAHGPLLMIRTERGQHLLEKLAIHRRFWKLYAEFGIPLMIIGMLCMTLILISFDIIFFTTHPQPTALNEPRNILLIPGVNEFIPLGYGLIALFITLVVHEVSHAVLCKVEGIKVKSMGLLLLLVPIGGFAEPDEDELFSAKRRERMRVLTAGVMSNFVIALITFTLFFAMLHGISPTNHNVVIVGVEEGSPADLAGVNIGVVKEVNGVEVYSLSDVYSLLENVQEGENVRIRVDDMESVVVAREEHVNGMKVRGVVDGAPAQKAGIKSGMIIKKIDNKEIRGVEDFRDFMNCTKPGQKVKVITDRGMFEFKLASADGKGFMGVYVQDDVAARKLGLLLMEFPADSYLSLLKSIPHQLDTLGGWLLLITLPILGGLGLGGFTGFTGLLNELYEPIMGGKLYMWITSALFWTGWINFNVGLFNCLPAVPLDGGHVFRDSVATLLERFVCRERVERMVEFLALMFAYIIFGSIVLMIVGPYVNLMK